MDKKKEIDYKRSDVEDDDVWHNTDVMLGSRVRQPPERRHRFNFAYGFIMGTFLRDGISMVVEHGTTALQKEGAK